MSRNDGTAFYAGLLVLAMGAATIMAIQRGDPPPTDAAAERAIAAVRDGFAAAFAQGDVNALLRFYDRDYVDASFGTADRGRTEMAAAFAETFERYVGELAIQPAEVLVHGDWALERGTFAIRLEERSSEAVSISHRRYLEILIRREDDHWYIFRDLDNELPQRTGHGPAKQR